ncbi:MAG: ribonucleoside-diphosphate reductase, adenosylcobalamin-dependent, partial [Thermodesulfobacteriota bacterium]
SFYTVDNVFKSKLNEYGMDNEEVYSNISQNGGSIMGMNFPAKLKRIFVTSLDIPWWDHIRAQSEINIWTCAAVSKTINMPSWAKAEDVLNSYILAHKLGCKGITVYRDGSKSAQVIYVKDNGKNKQEETVRLVKNRTKDIAKELGVKIKLRTNTITAPKYFGDKKCPVCNNEKILYQSGCVTCPNCGWSECSIA